MSAVFQSNITFPANPNMKVYDIRDGSTFKFAYPEPSCKTAITFSKKNKVRDVLYSSFYVSNVLLSKGAIVTINDRMLIPVRLPEYDEEYQYAYKLFGTFDDLNTLSAFYYDVEYDDSLTEVYVCKNRTEFASALVNSSAPNSIFLIETDGVSVEVRDIGNKPDRFQYFSCDHSLRITKITEKSEMQAFINDVDTRTVIKSYNLIRNCFTINSIGTLTNLAVAAYNTYPFIKIGNGIMPVGTFVLYFRESISFKTKCPNQKYHSEVCAEYENPISLADYNASDSYKSVSGIEMDPLEDINKYVADLLAPTIINGGVKAYGLIRMTGIDDILESFVPRLGLLIRSSNNVQKVTFINKDNTTISSVIYDRDLVMYYQDVKNFEYFVIDYRDVESLKGNVVRNADGSLLVYANDAGEDIEIIVPRKGTLMWNIENIRTLKSNTEVRYVDSGKPLILDKGYYTLSFNLENGNSGYSEGNVWFESAKTESGEVNLVSDDSYTGPLKLQKDYVKIVAHSGGNTFTRDDEYQSDTELMELFPNRTFTFIDGFLFNESDVEGFVKYQQFESANYIGINIKLPIIRIITNCYNRKDELALTKEQLDLMDRGYIYNESFNRICDMLVINRVLIPFDDIIPIGCGIYKIKGFEELKITSITILKYQDPRLYIGTQYRLMSIKSRIVADILKLPTNTGVSKVSVLKNITQSNAPILDSLLHRLASSDLIGRAIREEISLERFTAAINKIKQDYGVISVNSSLKISQEGGDKLYINGNGYNNKYKSYHQR